MYRRFHVRHQRSALGQVTSPHMMSGHPAPPPGQPLPVCARPIYPDRKRRPLLGAKQTDLPQTAEAERAESDHCAWVVTGLAEAFLVDLAKFALIAWTDRLHSRGQGVPARPCPRTTRWRPSTSRPSPRRPTVTISRSPGRRSPDAHTRARTQPRRSLRRQRGRSTGPLPTLPGPTLPAIPSTPHHRDRSPPALPARYGHPADSRQPAHDQSTSPQLRPHSHRPTHCLVCDTSTGPAPSTEPHEPQRTPAHPAAVTLTRRIGSVSRTV